MASASTSNRITLEELENNIIHSGINYIISKYPTKDAPLQLCFLFAGSAKLECAIIKGLVERGYSISKIWFVDILFKNPAYAPMVTETLTNESGLSKIHTINEDILMTRYNLTLSRPTSNITKKTLFKINNDTANIIFINSFNSLNLLMEKYVSPDEDIEMFAIHMQSFDEDARHMIGNFFKMYLTKFNKPIVFLWREPSFKAVVEPFHIDLNLDGADVYKSVSTIQRELLKQTGGKIAPVRHKYKGHLYKIRTGIKGGKYILVQGVKMYI